MADIFNQTLVALVTNTKRLVFGTPGTVLSEAENITHEDYREQIGDEIISNADEKTTPVNADELGISDSENAFILKALTLLNLKAFLGYDLGFALSDEISDLTTDNDAEIEVIRAQTLESLTFYVNTAPVGSSIIVELYKNAGLIETLTLPAASKTVTVANTTTFAVGDRLKADITQIGATTAGAGGKLEAKTKLD